MIEVQTQVPLAPLTTFRIGGNALELVVAKTESELLESIKDQDQILLLGSGSNLLISDDGFPGRVIQVKTSGINDSGGQIEVAAGENWDKFVSWAITQGYGEVAPLTGIPGTVGATPIQNVGAYGTEVSELISFVKVFDRRTNQLIIMKNTDCEFSYRNSVFKRLPNTFVIVSVTFSLSKCDSIKIKYDELATKLGVVVGDFADASKVLTAVRELRASKGMLLDPTDRDTYSVGSFFLNPRIEAKKRTELPIETPAWEQPDGTWKVSAAWLINQTGFERGYRIGDAGISTKHSLALTNQGNASAKDILSLAATIKNQVSAKFGIELEFEPQIL